MEYHTGGAVTVAANARGSCGAFDADIL